MRNIFSISTALFLVALVCSPFFASATAGAAPIDGGLSLLVAAGVGYSAKKFSARKQKVNNK